MANRIIHISESYLKDLILDILIEKMENGVSAVQATNEIIEELRRREKEQEERINWN